MLPELTVNFVHTDSMGYGRMAVRLNAALERNGVRLVDGMQGEKTNAAMWMSTPSHARDWFAGQSISILTMWETQRLAEGMTEGLHNFDLVLVPSEQNVELFSSHHDNVQLALLGVDEQWRYVERTMPDQFFDFLIGGSGARKGTDLAFAAFNKVFGDFQGPGPIPRLVMKNPRREGFAGPNVEVIGGKISGDDELDLYARAHCYLQPSRGEGFGMQPLQAIAQGCPTILTDAHGHASFAHLGYGIGASSSKADYFSHGYAGDWWEPDFDELCERMEWVYDNYGEACAFAAHSATTAALEFTWDHTAQAVIAAHGDALTVPYTGSGAVVAADLKRYRLMVVKPWRAEIAGLSYAFEPGRVYWETADVLRILFDGDVLDPACIDEERGKGLTDDQLSRLGDYSAAHSWCHACNQQLNSGPSKADYLMAVGEVARLSSRVAELEGVSV